MDRKQAALLWTARSMSFGASDFPIEIRQPDCTEVCSSFVAGTAAGSRSRRKLSKKACLNCFGQLLGITGLTGYTISVFMRDTLFRFPEQRGGQKP
jgi:hypothetical protein